ncbi:hypothetical protein, partial [uncultured Desulfovibrio sp.]
MRILHKQQHLSPLEGPRLEPHPFHAAGAPPDERDGAPLVPVGRPERGDRPVAAPHPSVPHGEAFEFRQLGEEDFEEFEALLRYAF